MAHSSNSIAERHCIVPEPNEETRVWDIFVRVFHWTLVVAFLIAYFTGDDLLLLLHVWTGYLVGMLVMLRIIWGFIGPRHARFTSFVYRPRKILRHTRDLLRFGGRRYLGHSPAGGAMVVALLVMVLLIVGTGLLTLATSEGAGPLAGYFQINRAVGRFWKDIHEILVNITLGLVLIHVGGVLWASLVHGENLIRAMWNGRKKAYLDHNEFK